MSSNNANHEIEDEAAVGDVSKYSYIILDCKIILYYYCLIIDNLPIITHIIGCRRTCD